MPSSTSYTERCSAALRQALHEVPGYQGWRRFDPGEGVPLDQRFASLPLLDKRAMNAVGPSALVPSGRSLDEALRTQEVSLVSTSGSTEDKVVNVWCQSWWDASERASWALNAHARRAATGDHPEAILANPLNVGLASDSELSFEQRRLGRFLYLNERVDPLSWTDRHCERMLEELERFRPAVLEANPSLLSRLSRFVLREGLRPFRPALVTLTYEYPSRIHLRHIRAAFGAPLMSSYGSTEAGYVFAECEHGTLHQNVRSCHVDLLPFARGLGGPGLGKLLVTTFDNPWRALVRFDVGDLGRLACAPCPCGNREGLALAEVEGRAVNLTLSLDGAPVTQAEVDRRLSPIAAIDEYQLRQLGPRAYHLGIACDSGGFAAAARAAKRALEDLYGEGAHVEVEESRSLAPEASGKYRLAKALFPVDAAAFLAPGSLPPKADSN